MAGEKEVTLRLRVVSDRSNRGAFEAVNRLAQETQRHLERTGRAMAATAEAMAAGAAGRGATPAAGADRADRADRAGKSAFDRALRPAALLAASNYAGQVARGAGAFADPSLNRSQQTARFLTDLPLLGGAAEAVYGVSDLFSGRAGQRARNELAQIDRLALAQAGEAVNQGEAQKAGLRRGLLGVRAEAGAQAALAAGVRGAGTALADPFTGAAQLGQLQAEAGLGAAQRVEAGARREEADGQRHFNQLLGEAARLRRELAQGAADDLTQQDRLRRSQVLENQLQAEGGRLLEAQQRTRESAVMTAQRQLELVRAEGALRAAQTNKFLGVAEAFGGMSEPDQFGTLQSLKLLKERGLGALHPEERARLKGLPVAGELVRNAEVAAFQQSSRRDEILETLGLSDLKGLRGGRLQLQADVQAQLVANEAEVGRAIADKLGPLIERAVVNIAAQVGSKVFDADLKRNLELIERRAGQAGR